MKFSLVRFIPILTVIALSNCFPNYSMAQTAYLTLKIDGNDIEGESRVVSLDRGGTIECSTFNYELTTPREDASGQLTGKRQHKPVVIKKLIDKTTPLILKALCNNEPVTSAEFKFYRVNKRTSREELYFTVLLENGYISSVKMASNQKSPLMEEVEFVFQDITWTYEIDGATHHDSMRGE